MDIIVYSLCAVMSAACFGLLLREYFRNRGPLLLSMSFCFFGLFLSNLVLLCDRFVFQTINLANLRVLPALLGLAVLVYGLIQEGDER
jgi:drug/metabolite transporter (DMT)-like permease